MSFLRSLIAKKMSQRSSSFYYDVTIIVDTTLLNLISRSENMSKTCDKPTLSVISKRKDLR